MKVLRFAAPLLAAAATICCCTGVAQAATANTDVGPTPYYITIYDETTGAELAVCGTGTTCSAAVSESSTGSQRFEAFIGDDVPGTGHPGFVLVASNQVTATWWRFVIIGRLSPVAG